MDAPTLIVPRPAWQRISHDFDAISQKKLPDVKVFPSNEKNLVFELPEAPGIIFKIGKCQRDFMNTRFRNMERGRLVCKTHQLGLLKIPMAEIKEVQIKDHFYAVLAEEKLHAVEEESKQEELYANGGASLTQAIEQLALFILETAWDDAEWRNAPVLEEKDSLGNLIIGLIDLEDRSRASLGLFGGLYGRRGLIGMINKDQGERVVAIAKKHAAWSAEFAEEAALTLSLRSDEIDADARLKIHHLRKGITVGSEPVIVPVEDLALPDGLQPAARDIVDEINALIKLGNEKQSVKGRRKLILRGCSVPAEFVLKFNIQKPALLRGIRIHSYTRRLPGDTHDRAWFNDNDKPIIAICLEALVKSDTIFSYNYNNEWNVQV